MYHITFNEMFYENTLCLIESISKQAKSSIKSSQIYLQMIFDIYDWEKSNLSFDKMIDLPMLYLNIMISTSLFQDNKYFNGQK